MDMSIQRFIQLLAAEKNEINRRIMQFQFELGARIREQMVENVDRQFGHTKGKPWSMPVTGALRRSITMRAEGQQIVLTAGGPGVPYAVIHEFGGTIKPVRRVWLTVPAKRKFVRRRAREFNLRFIEIKKGRLAALIDPRAPKGDQVAYWLVKSVRIPSRPYFVPAAKQVLDSGVAEKLAQQYLVKTQYGLDWEITND